MVCGTYSDSTHAYHAFVRATDGAITSFDVAGGGTGVGEGTVAYSINKHGVIGGYMIDQGDVYHGFLRSPSAGSR